MFDNVTLFGHQASLLWGYRQAVVLRGWQITKKPKGEWQLSAGVDRIDAFQARQKPLLFAAPRQKGFWSFPVKEVQQLNERRLKATLGPPEY